MESFDEFYWKHNDYLNKDTSLAHSFGEKVWLHKQQEVDELQKRIDEAIKEIQDESWSDEYGDNQAPTFKLIKILKGENHES